MKEGIYGSKKTEKEANANINPKIYELVVPNSSIKTDTLNCCLDLLRDNKSAKVVKVGVYYK